MSYAGLSPHEIQARMDARYATETAYPLTLPWDIARMEELAEVTLRLVGDVKGARVLDIACGTGGLAAEMAARQAAEHVGIDLSPEAIRQAREGHRHLSTVRFEVMDAQHLAFPDSSFHRVIAREALEHMPDARQVCSEIARVLVPGGRLVLTSPNRDSLHLRMARALGHPEFLCSMDHIRELTYGECCDVLSATGFRIVETAGVFLMPYWGIPGVDGPVRTLTDRDAETIALFRDLGRRVGPEYAFCYVIAAETHQ